MKVIACRPADDQFWIGCNKEEALNIFLPKLSPEEKESFFQIIEEMKRKEKKEYDSYWEAIKEATDTEEIYYAYFNVSRDLSICFPQYPHYPISNMWNAYNPFRKIDHTTIKSLEELKDLKMTYEGEEYGKEV